MFLGGPKYPVFGAYFVWIIFYNTCVLFVTHVIMLLYNIMCKMLRFYVYTKGLIFDPKKGTPKKASFVGPRAP